MRSGMWKPPCRWPHAISTNKMNMESDYFTAMDDLLSGEVIEEKGSAMIGDTDYNSACYYIYASLDTDILMKNLKDTPDAEQLVKAAIPALIRTMGVDQPIMETEQLCWKRASQCDPCEWQGGEGAGQYGQRLCAAD